MTTLKNIAAEYLWLWLAALLGLAIYIGCQWMTPWYGYTAIVRPPEIPTPLSELTGNTVKSPSLFGLNSLPTMVQEAQAYVEFRYVKKIKEPGMKAFIKSATSSKDSPYLELVVYGVSLKAASDYLDEVLVQLRKAYHAKVQDGRADVEKQIAVLSEKITQEKEILRRTQDVGKRLGFSPTLLETSMQLERDLLKVQLNRELLIGSISDQKLFNFRLVEARPLDSRRPVFPRPKLFAAVGAILAASVLFFFGFGRKPKIAPAVELHAAEERRRA